MAKKNGSNLFWVCFSLLVQNSFPNFKIQNFVGFLFRVFNYVVLFFIYMLIDILKEFSRSIEYSKTTSLLISMHTLKASKFVLNQSKILISKSGEFAERSMQFTIVVLVAWLIIFRLKLHDWGFKLSPQKLMAVAAIIFIAICIAALPKLKLGTHQPDKSS